MTNIRLAANATASQCELTLRLRATIPANRRRLDEDDCCRIRRNARARRRHAGRAGRAERRFDLCNGSGRRRDPFGGRVQFATSALAWPSSLARSSPLACSAPSSLLAHLASWPAHRGVSLAIPREKPRPCAGAFLSRSDQAVAERSKCRPSACSAASKLSTTARSVISLPPANCANSASRRLSVRWLRRSRTLTRSIEAA